jgi:hypothetical protein
MSASYQERALAARFVSREHLGLARLLLNKISAADDAFIAVIDAVVKRMEARLGKPPRYRDLTELERNWRAQMPTEGGIRAQIDRPKRGIRITETRLSTFKLKSPGWENSGGGEPGISVITMWLEFAPTGFRHGLTNHAYASLHALGRRFSRGFDCSEVAVIADLAALADAAIDEKPGRLFSVPRPDGRWAGHVTQFRDGLQVPLVRTWLDPRDA